MSARLLQFSPQPNAPAIRARATVEPWSRVSESPRDLGIVQSWFDFDPDCDFIDAPGEKRTNWGGIFALTLVLTFSVGFWTGVAVIAERIWK